MAELAVEAMAFGTTKTSNYAWEQRGQYCRLRGTEPYLTGETRGEKLRDEEELLLFIVHLGVTMGRASGTVLQKLFGIRQGHILLGYPGPPCGQ